MEAAGFGNLFDQAEDSAFIRQGFEDQYERSNTGRDRHPYRNASDALRMYHGATMASSLTHQVGAGPYTCAGAPDGTNVATYGDLPALIDLCQQFFTDGRIHRLRFRRDGEDFCFDDRVSVRGDHWHVCS